MVDFLPLHEVLNSVDHATDLGRILMNDGLADFAKSEAVKRFALFFGASDATADLSDMELCSHRGVPSSGVEQRRVPCRECEQYLRESEDFQARGRWL